VANLTNNKDVFLCILRFHARAGYLQTYETLLKEINAHPGSEEVPRYNFHLTSMLWRAQRWQIEILMSPVSLEYDIPPWQPC
jgi:hypothetical protein